MSKEKWWPAPRYLFRKNLIIQLLKGKKIESILEVGYGAGDMLVTYSKKVERVYGYDFSDLAREIAHERIRSSGITNVKLLESLEEIEHIEKVTCLVACEVLEHVEDDDLLLVKWKGYINTHGYILLSVPSREKKWCLNDIWAGHIRRYEKRDLIKKLKRVGFEVEKFWSYPFPFNLILDPMLNKAAKELGVKNKGNIEKTKESGVVRTQNPIYRFICNKYVMGMLYPIQKLFVNTDLGSGYIVLARKVK